MKYKQYLVYTSVNFIGFWFMLGAQLTSLNNFLPTNDTKLARQIDQHEMRWCFGWLFVTAVNTLFQSWYWRKERREAAITRPKTKIPAIKIYKQR